MPFSARRLKAAAQFLLAITVTAALLLALAGSSPTGFSNSATAPAAAAVADVFVRYRARTAPLSSPPPPDPPAVPAADNPSFPLSPFSPSPSHATIDLLAPLPRAERVSKQNAWVLAKPADQLPKCDKILLFTFMPWWGFASEYILYLRAAAAAKRLGYTLVEDDRNWNYGRLTDYFLPRKLSCVPPSDWSDHRKAYPFHQGSNWKGRPRLRYSRLVLSNLDDWTREEYLSSPTAQRALGELKRADEEHAREGDRWILEPGGTLPGVFGEVFKDQAEVVGEMWRLKASMREQVEEVKRRIGLDREKAWSGVEARKGEEGRGPIIALHVRLGDKASEYEHDSKEMGITNSFGNLTVYIEAAHDAYRRLIPSHYPSLSSSPSSHRFTPYARPSLLLITAEPFIASRISSIPLAGPFRLLETPKPDVRGKEVDEETRRRLEEQQKVEGEKEREGGGGPKAYVGSSGDGGGGTGKMIKLAKGGGNGGGGGGGEEKKGELAKRAEEESSSPPADLSGGYNQAAFNALPILKRVVHTQAFVRDLTLIAREVDAAVMSGSSNIGRLAMLIAGKDAVTGPSDSEGRSLGGRIRSIDAHFYPTAYSTAVYTKLKDVEDMDHAAFIPEEQHAAEQKAAEEKRRKKKEKGKRDH